LLDNQRLGRKEPNILIIGVDYHPSFQQIAFLDQETGESGERRLNHSDGEAEKFYRDLKQRGVGGGVRMGMEATGYSRWFERLLATAIDYPNVIGDTTACGINDSGQIVGQFQDGTGNHGFVDAGGVFTTIDYPSAIAGTTFACGINDNGQVVGFFRDSTGDHGFIATPEPVPEPGTLTLLCSCLIGLAVAFRRKSALARPN
jgi:probable HAF family extracellular repeat protein